MEDFRILDPDPYNNSTGSASLQATSTKVQIKQAFFKDPKWHGSWNQNGMGGGSKNDMGGGSKMTLEVIPKWHRRWILNGIGGGSKMV